MKRVLFLLSAIVFLSTNIHLLAEENLSASSKLLLPPLKKKIKIPVIVIDPGHGGNDHGAKAESGLKEKDVVLDIAQKTRNVLQSLGFQVVMTRSDDRFIPLSERVEICKASSGDLFLSIHANSAPNKKASGFETFFLSPNKRGTGIEKYKGFLTYLKLSSNTRKSFKIAKLVQFEMTQKTGGIDRGIKMARFHVLRNSLVPAILVETGFLSNEEEAAALSSEDYRNKVAIALANSVRRFNNW